MVAELPVKNQQRGNIDFCLLFQSDFLTLLFLGLYSETEHPCKEGLEHSCLPHDGRKQSKKGCRDKKLDLISLRSPMFLSPSKSLSGNHQWLKSTSKMTQWVKVLATEHDGLSSLRLRWWKKRNSSHSLFSDCHMPIIVHVYLHTHVHTHPPACKYTYIGKYR